MFLPVCMCRCNKSSNTAHRTHHTTPHHHATNRQTTKSILYLQLVAAEIQRRKLFSGFSDHHAQRRACLAGDGIRAFAHENGGEEWKKQAPGVQKVVTTTNGEGGRRDEKLWDKGQTAVRCVSVCAAPTRCSNLIALFIYDYLEG